MKLPLKLFLILCLFSSVTLADGDQGNGGFTGDQGNGGKTAVKIDVASCDGDQGNGGRAVNDQSESILTFIQKYLISIFE